MRDEHSAGIDPAVVETDPSVKIRRVLDESGRSLRFSDGALEEEFATHLAATQRNCALASAWIGIAIWSLFLAIDFMRYGSLDADASKWNDFLWLIFVPRTAGLLCLAVALIAHMRNHAVWGEKLIMITILVISLAITTTTCTYQNLGIPAASSAHLLMIVAAFSPIGVRFHRCFFLAVVLIMMSLLLGLLILQKDHVESHLILIGMMCVTLLLAATGSRTREASIRKQFLLSRLLDWRANHDALTGLFNRHKLNENAPVFIRQAKRDRACVSLAVIDIDHFKAYNDFYGHQAGDAVIRKVGELLKGYARKPLDMAIRIGGEEFAVFCYGETADTLHARMQHLQEDLKRLAIAHERSPTAALVTVSIGIAQWGDDAADFDRLFKAADDALYASKTSGRNRCTVAFIDAERNQRVARQE